MSAVDDTEARIQTCGRRSCVRSRDRPGGLLLMYDLLLLIIGCGSKELMLQLLTIGGLLIAVPFVAGFFVSLLEATQEPIKEFIES